MDEILYYVVKIVVILAVVTITRYIVPYLKQKLMAAVGENVYSEIEKQVRSVEQTIKGAGMGAVKKEKVVDRISLWALDHGIKITYDQISDLIETAVFVMNNED